MNVNHFTKMMKGDLDLFIAWWKEQMDDPDFPEEMDEQDWEEQFLLFRETLRDQEE